MTLREIFNSILDTDLKVLALLIFGIGALAFWTIYMGMLLYDFNKRLDRYFEARTSSNARESESLTKSLLLFFPRLFWAMLPFTFLFFIGIAIYFAPIIFVAMYLDSLI